MPIERSFGHWSWRVSDHWGFDKRRPIAVSLTKDPPEMLVRFTLLVTGSPKAIPRITRDLARHIRKSGERVPRALREALQADLASFTETRREHWARLNAGQ